MAKRGGDRYVWTAEQLFTLGQRYANTPTEDLAAVLGLTIEQVYRKARFLDLKKSDEYTRASLEQLSKNLNESGKRHQFPKGHKPWNDGLKGIQTGGVETRFKKGQVPHTWVPVGSFRVLDGYLYEKLTEEPGAYNKRWFAVHRTLWEQANGPVPEGSCLTFKPGRKSIVLEEITLDALELVSRRELLARNSIVNMPKPLADLVRARGLLTRAINRKSKEQSHE